MHLRRRKRKVYQERRTTPLVAEEYRLLHRFSKENVSYLAQEFLEESNETRGGALSAIQRMELTLRYLADPGFQRSVSYQVGVSQSTVCATVRKTIMEISTKANRWIRFPNSRDDIRTAQENWFQNRGFPSCFCAIDCTHVRIEKPKGIFGDDFINRKKFPSMNVQATCNSECVFTSVDAGWPGSVHDNRIFKNSDIYQLLLQRRDTVILGDEGYGITPFLMTPYKNPVTNEQKAYNKLHTNNRVIIEQCFGQLKRRFPILRYGIRLKMDIISPCIITCFVLHNVAKHLSDPEFEEEFEEEIPDIHLDDEPIQQNAQNLRAQGQIRRNALAETIFTFNF